MRSRFAAFAIADAEYLWRTLHPDHEERALPKEDVIRALKAAARACKYMRLTILEAKGSEVLFRASVFEKGKDRSFIELSTFAKEGSAWRYLTGIARDASEAGEPGDARGLTIDSFK